MTNESILSTRDQTLVNGYIRRTQNDLKSQTIPTDISDICALYFQYRTIYFFHHDPESTEFKFRAAAVGGGISTSYKLHNPEGERSANIVWNSGMSHQRNFRIPCSVNQRIHDTFSNDDFLYSPNGEYDVILNCGGSLDDFNGSTKCYGYVLSPINRDKTEQMAFRWTLPSYAEPLECHSILYTPNHGLLSFGGYASGRECKFQRLRFDQDREPTEWERMPSTEDKRSWTSSVQIGEDRVMVVGGYDVNVGALRGVEVFDFSTNRWDNASVRNIKKKRYGTGIVFHENTKRVFISGGDKAQHSTEWYDFAKNKWYLDIPEYSYKLNRYPAVWIENHTQLLVASETANRLLCLDLREMKRWTQWKCPHDTSRHLKVSDLLGIGVPMAGGLRGFGRQRMKTRLLI